MSTAISSTETTTILPKSVAKLKLTDEKPRLQRSSSIDTIKRINTYICSPQSYLLPAILTTWLKTSQNGLQTSTEKTIFMFRSLIFGSFIVKYLLKCVKSGSLGGQVTKIDLHKALLQIILGYFEKFLKSVKSKFIISIVFKLAVVYLTVQAGLCVLFLAGSIVPIGLSFLIVSLTCIAVLGYRLNGCHCEKRYVKRKIH